ncbi:MAG: cation-transporting P-type ATPase [Gammaproteobacteria bacterium]|nr:cation-transporting P-type ATPase [Gammaproteobacteria bacterium]
MNTESNPERQSWHSDDTQEVLDALQSDGAGLSQDEAEHRLERYGPNRLPSPPRLNPILRFLRHFHNVLIYVLIGAAFITATLGHYADTGVILAVVLINAFIGFLQEGRAEKAMDSIRQMLALHASVLREGNRHSLPGEDLVPGDIVLLEAGDKVPADLRLLKSHGLQIQESVLTGESVAVDKQTSPVADASPLGDRSCMAYSGTTVTNGQGRGIVVATGGATELGRISDMLSQVEMLQTPLLTQMAVFAKWLTAIILVLSTLILIYGHYYLNQAFNEVFMAVVGIAVAAIPEGLPAVLTITLAVGVQAMARRNAIVRRLPAIETLGSVSVICSDKTGTLTRNEMNVTTVVTAEHRYDISGAGYEPNGDIHRQDETVDPTRHPLLHLMGRTAALCNDARLQHTGTNWESAGDPMEAALLAFAGKAGMDGDETRDQWSRTDIIPFDTQTRYMATLNHNHEGEAGIFLKGAPEAVLGMCRRQRQQDGQELPLDESYWQQQAEAIAASGQRVLALAMREVPPEHTVLERADIEGSLTFLGLVGLIDPPREEAIDAVSECHSAGIAVKMITGDHAATALAIGRQLGLKRTSRALTGAELDGLDDDALAHAVKETDIFARTSPEHKLRLVMALQAQGMTVAMTGDGVNDAPALKRAGAGIAMGRNGSEAAKEAAEIVLADDNFASIVAAVREGRTVYDNIKKVISWTLPTNTGEAMTIIIALLLGLSLPITPIQILWINMITAVSLGIALAFEPSEANIMRRPPRPRKAPLLDKSLSWHIVLVAALFLAAVFGIFEYAIYRGYSEALAQSLAVNTLAVLEIFHLFYIRNMYGTALNWKAVRGTRAVWLAVAVVTLGQFAITYLPWLQSVFGTEAIGLIDGLIIIGLGVLLFVIIELEKQIRLRLVSRHD